MNIAAWAGCLLMAHQPTPPVASLRLFDYDRRAALEMRRENVASGDSLLEQLTVSYASPDGGRVSGTMLRPRRATGASARDMRRRAGVLVLHGLPGTAASAVQSQGRALARAGAVVLAIDAPWVRRGGLPDFTPRDSVEQVQLIRDLRRAVDVLLQHEQVDSSRVGFIGGSYGGAMGTLFVAAEPRLAAAVLFVADGGLVSHSTTPEGAPLGPLADLPADARTRWLNAMLPIEPVRFASHITRTPLLLQNGRQDQFVPPPAAAALHAAITSAKTVEWYDSGHGLPRAALDSRVRWLSSKLGLPTP
jgi:uncharacterized protein